MRIRVTPEQLSQVGQEFTRLSDAFNEIQQLIQRAEAAISPEVFQVSARRRLEPQIGQAKRQAGEIAEMLGQAANHLRDVSGRFSEADQRGIAVAAPQLSFGTGKLSAPISGGIGWMGSLGLSRVNVPAIESRVNAISLQDTPDWLEDTLRQISERGEMQA